MNRRTFFSIFFSLILILIISDALFRYFGLHDIYSCPQGAFCSPPFAIILGGFLKYISTGVFFIGYILFEVQYLRKRDLLLAGIFLVIALAMYLGSFWLTYLGNIEALEFI